ncbi:MAG: squalene/oxidosqualene cyclase [Gemmataceae bacterium]|nr:squalene/oxidosqualene cyclase [Gemmataceae bacterium]
MTCRLVILIGVSLALGLPALSARTEHKPAAPPPPTLRPKPAEPVPAEKLDAAVRRGVEFLVASQNKDGSWGSPAIKGGVPIIAGVGSHHAFGVAVTAMCVSALIETGGDPPEVRKAIERGEAHLFAELGKVRRDDPMLIYNVWAHAYGTQALVRMHRRLPDDTERRKRIEDLIRGQYERLTKYESAEGGWGYYDFEAGTQRPASSSTSFVNAAVLMAFHEAKGIGVPPPEKVLKRAVKMTQFQRQSDGTFLYGTYLWSRPTMGINRPGGSLGRSQACNLVLRLWGDEKVTDADLKVWLDRLVTRNGWLSLGRKKPIPHESFFQVAGYFYYFGHYYAALTIPRLPAADRPFYQDHLATILLDLQEADGSWWDYPMYNYHKPYGTAFTLMSLAACRKEPPKGEK